MNIMVNSGLSGSWIPAIRRLKLSATFSMAPGWPTTILRMRLENRASCSFCLSRVRVFTIRHLAILRRLRTSVSTGSPAADPAQR